VNHDRQEKGYSSKDENDSRHIWGNQIQGFIKSRRYLRR
jgi:hypothetical protein